MPMSRKDMKKIVYVIGSMGRGGAEAQLLMLMEGLQKSEFRPHLFVLEKRGDLLENVHALGIPVWDGGYDSCSSHPKKVAQLSLALIRLWNLLRREKPCIVHGVLPLANFFAAVAGRLAGTSCIITSRRALNTHQDRVPGWRWADMLSARLSHKVIVNSKAVKEDTLYREGGDPGKIAVIYNGISLVKFRQSNDVRENVREELGLSSDDEVLIIVANLIPYKGHRELLKAVAAVRPDFPRIRLIVVGEDRGIGGSLQREAEKLGIDDVIHWLGMRRDVSRLLAAADLYVSASHEEGFSNSLLEAMAAGKPVVATRVGGNPEMLEDGVLGVLVEPGNVGELTSAIHHLLTNSRKRAVLGKRASTRVALKYASSRMVEAYLQGYRECCS